MSTFHSRVLDANGKVVGKDLLSSGGSVTLSVPFDAGLYSIQAQNVKDSDTYTFTVKD